MHISEAEGASDFAFFMTRVRGRYGSRIRAAPERHLQDVVVVPCDLELSREYGEVEQAWLRRGLLR
jgi:hypothetical protein